MDAATPVDAGAPQKSAAELVPGMPVLAEPVETIVDDPTLQLQSTEVIVRVRVPRDSDEEVLRVTGYRSMDYETGMSPTGESALLNRVVELPLDQNEIRVELELAPMLYYQATVGEGDAPQAGDWMGAMTQWLGDRPVFLMVSQMRLE